VNTIAPSKTNKRHSAWVGAFVGMTFGANTLENLCLSCERVSVRACVRGFDATVLVMMSCL